MARRLKTRAQAQKARTSTDLDTPGVSSVELPARPLYVVEPDSLLWGKRGIMPEVAGAIVWVLPPHDATDGDVLMLRQRLEKHGAAHIKVLPREPDPNLELPEPDAPDLMAPDEEGPDSVDQSLRDVVMGMARERASGDELEALTEALDEAMTEVGL